MSLAKIVFATAITGALMTPWPEMHYPRDAHAAPVARPATVKPSPRDIPVIPPGSAYIQANLVSDIPGLALLTDSLLVNPWGIATRGASPFWVANNGTSTSRIYQEAMGTDALIVNPTLAGITTPGGLPTGVVGNSTADFLITPPGGGAPAAATFIFNSITGNLVAWNAASGGAGQIVLSMPGHVWTGLATGTAAGGSRLYAADFANNHIDVFDGTFATAAGPFVDPTIPAGYAPFNIQNIGGSLYVTYAKIGASGQPENGVGLGFVRRFNAEGVRDLTFGINNGALDAPWGVAIAAPTFGIFGGALLIGNFAPKGGIHAYNPTTGAFLGTVQTPAGTAVEIDQLRGLTIGNGGNGGDLGALYFSAGIGGEEHGLFGSLRPTTATATNLVEFSTQSFGANEASGSAIIAVVRSGDVSAPATVNYAAVPRSGAGFAGAADYALAPGTLPFAAGEASKTFVVTIVNDGVAEGNETLDLALSNATGAAIGGKSAATLTIVDGAGPIPPPIVIPPGSAYIQANLVSDIPGLALLTDSLLVNPWGIATRGASPFWVANNGTSTSRIYQEAMGTDALIVNPTLAGITTPGGLPTGVVGNSTADFLITPPGGGAPAAATFIFNSITGNLVAWNAASGGAGQIVLSMPGHVWTGLATGTAAGGSRLYAADFANNHIDVFDGTFATAAGPFVDPTIPAGYAPFNIQNIGGSLYVTYAKIGASGQPENGVGLGFVRRFNAEGVRDLTFGINNGALDAPWGVAIAAPTFGIFGGALLIGNFAPKGGIHAYNPTTGAFLGTVQTPAGTAVEIDQLRGLTIGNGGNGGDLGALYFSAGIGGEEHGLFGSLRPTTATASSLIQFGATDYTVGETTGTLNIPVLRIGDTTGAASVNYAALIDSGSGFAGAADFTLPPGTLTFAPGESVKTIVVAIANDALLEGPETFRVVLSNATGAGLGSPSVSQITIVDNGIGTSNLSIAKSAPPGAVEAGDNFTYTLSISNAGPDAAMNVVVTDALPSGVSFVSVTTSQGSCSGTAVVTCNLGTLAASAGATISLTVQANGTGLIVNTAMVSSAQSDPVSANNSGSASVNVAAAFVPTIPTLEWWALMVLAVMLAAVAGVSLRRRG